MYKVLIVDDDKTSRYILKQYKEWTYYGFSIEGEACDGKEALKILQSCQFDLIITDIKMPGMDGIELLNELKIMKYDICVMMLSTHSDFEYAKQGIRLGAFDYIIKPVSDEVLSEALERAKLHLYEKYLHKNKSEDEKKQIKESTMLYYPKNCEKRLASLILSGNSKVIEEAEKTFFEIDSIFREDPFKKGILLENLLMKLLEQIYIIWPWLEKIEVITFNGEMSYMKSLDDIKTKYIEYITRMSEIIKKYELHQTDSLVKKTCAYVLDHVEEEISLEKIAQKVHASKDYIGKLFKQKTGCNFNQYVTKVKMEHAKYLLKFGNYKNYEVSEKLGYSNTDYFCRLFKNYTGYTPVEFRKNTL